MFHIVTIGLGCTVWPVHVRDNQPTNDQRRHDTAYLNKHASKIVRLGLSTSTTKTKQPIGAKTTLALGCFALRQDGTRCLVTVVGESGFEAQAGPIIVSGYSGVCFEIKFSGRHRGFDGVPFNL